MSVNTGGYMYIRCFFFLSVLFPSIAFSQCLTALTVTNGSKYPVIVYVNKQPVAALQPGQSLEDSAYLNPGNNAVNVKPLTKKGEISTKVKGPKDTKFVPTCEQGSTSTIVYQNNNFVSNKGSGGHGHGPSVPKKPIKVGNPKGRKIDLTGRWVSLSDPANCTLDISEEFTGRILGSLVCRGSSAFMEGTRIGAKLLLAGIGQSIGFIDIFAAEFAIFSDITVEFEDEKVKLDAFVGKIFLPGKADIKFVRPSA